MLTQGIQNIVCYIVHFLYNPEKKKTLQIPDLQRLCFLLFKLVPRPGVEPGRVAPLVFETSASTDSAIWARKAGAKLQRKIDSCKRIY